MDGPPLRTTLGLVVIDEIRYGSGHVVEDVLAGSGSYCTASIPQYAADASANVGAAILGARLFCAGPSSHSLAWLVRAGDEFPDPVAAQIGDWEVDLNLERLPGRPSTRGLLVYQDSTFGPKTFQYTTPVLSLQPEHFQRTRLLASRYIHTLCDPHTIRTQVEGLLNLRNPLAIEAPYVVWEPAPPSCVPENLEPCQQHARFVDVFSPNHVELLALFGRPETDFTRELIHDLASRFLDAGVGRAGQGMVVVRAGEHGCCIVSASVPPTWLPPYYDAHGAEHEARGKVIDTTGAGNAFLGGYIVGHAETGDAVEAACYGTVAASFMIEQVGVPRLRKASVAAREQELWNDESPWDRLESYRRRVGLSAKKGGGP